MKDNSYIIEVLLLNDLLNAGSIDQRIYTKALTLIRQDNPEVARYVAA